MDCDKTDKKDSNVVNIHNEVVKIIIVNISKAGVIINDIVEKPNVKVLEKD